MKKFLILTLFAGIPLLFLSCSKPEGKIPENEFIFNEIPTDSIQGYIARGFYRKALPLLIDELGIVTNDTLARLKLLLDISGLYLETGLPDSARKYLDKSKSVMDAVLVNDQLVKHRLFYLEGRYASFRREFGRALQSFDMALGVLQRLQGNEKSYSLTLNAMAYVYFWQSDPVTAEILYKKALDYGCADTSGIVPAIIARTGLLELYLLTGNINKAMEQTDFFIRYLNSPAANLHPCLFDACVLIGDHYFNIEKESYLTAFCFEKADSILNIFFDRNYYKNAVLYYSYGKAEADRLSYREAITHFEKTLEISAEYPPLYEYLFLAGRWLATIYQWMGNPEMALHYCHECIENVNGTYCSLAYTWLTMSRASKMLGDTMQALKYLEKGRLSAGNNSIRDNFRMQANIDAETGITHFERNEFAKALPYFKEAAIDLETTSPKGTLKSSTHIYLSRLYRSTGDYESALAESHRAVIALCNNFSDTSVLSDAGIDDTYLYYPLMIAYYWKAENLLSLYNADTARTFLLKLSNKCSENVVSLLEKMMTGIGNQNDVFERIDYTYGYINRVIDNTYKCYIETGSKEYAEKAFEFTEKSRLLAMRMYLYNGNRPEYADVPDPVDEHVTKLKKRILEIENTLGVYEPQMPEYHREALKSELAELYADNNRYTDFIKEKYLNYYKLNYPGGIKPQIILKELDREQVFIEYHITYPFLYTFLMTDNNYLMIRQIVPEDFFQNIGKIRMCLTSSPAVRNIEEDFRIFAEASCSLYDFLIKPVEGFIEDKRLLISPCDDLLLIPFEALLKTKPEDKKYDFGNADYLCRYNIITYLFSGGITELRKNRTNFLNRTAVFQPVFTGGISGKEGTKLPGASKEAETVKRITAGSIFRGREANKKEFIRNAGRYDILHIASHVTADTTAKGLACLQLGEPGIDGEPEDNRLYSWELLNANIDAKLVVLSGCNTGFGKLQTAAGIQSLALGFFNAGVRTIASTLWELPDNSASVLSAEFYKGLHKYKSPSKAMNEARLKLLNGPDPVKRHPYFWAGFIISGNDKPVLLAKSVLQYSAIIIIGVVALLLLVKIRKR